MIAFSILLLLGAVVIKTAAAVQAVVVAQAQIVTAVQVVELRALETRLQHLHLKEIMAQLEPLVVAIMLQAVVVVLVRQDQQQAMLL
jgi:hypothetical protein